MTRETNLEHYKNGEGAMKTRKEEEYLMLSREEMSKNERNALDTYYWVLAITKEILGAENMTENVLMVAIGTAGDVARFVGAKRAEE